MTRYAIAYAATMLVFLGIDAIWLSTMARRLYAPLLGDVLAPQVNIAPAVLFYLVYVAGVVIFAVAPAFGSGRWTTATLYGALFGFFAYATYDLTNHATIRGWPAVITVADLCWGTLLTAVSATAGFLIARYFAPGD